ncbi:class I SAM-dependent DNA methyltransferase [Teredinibacter turnerae]|uniref:class I SAM-dependent DNA methyltransferase n=1 Tax=Teredinibacter turnerae TaxID=2426 RepID=UPI0003F5C5BB|nr:DNA methyltransferase [Teredinibacter turnerae]
MNAVEIEEAISNLAEQAFDAASFPYAFLEAFGNKATTIKRLQSGATNASDIEGGVLQRSNIHIAVCAEGPNCESRVTATLNTLKASPATTKAKAKFILATDGINLEAEDLASGETVACDYKDFPNHFGFFLPLAGITTVKQIRDNTFDIRATSRLNRLYVELLRNNPDWGTSERRHDMNHFMARLIFCFFAEDTDIFNGDNLFTATIEQMSAKDSSNTHEVISEIFRSMNTKTADRKKENIRSWADGFPYVNGGLFSGSTEVPRFTKIARSYLLHVGTLDWKQINPDIFGSMIQAVADDEERGALGMHYTSVPNILKVLNPLFLDDLREQLEQAEDNPRKLLNLRKRMSNIRVFDPACGSGNFLVIAYKQMREIEAKINELRGEKGRPSDISLRSFRGIELRDFPAEIARLALIIAEYQCDLLYRGQKLALAEFLPLDTENWITSGNALEIDWLSVCPPTGKTVKLAGDDLFSAPTNQAEVDFENEGGETYICGNPPYLGSTWQSKEQKADLEKIFKEKTKTWKSLDYVAGWFMKAAEYGKHTNSASAFVSTNSICQGQQVPILWPLIFNTGHEISFAHTSFKWANLASHNAGVTVIIVGISGAGKRTPRIYSIDDNGSPMVKEAENVNAYLVSGSTVFVEKRSVVLSDVSAMERGNGPVDNGGLLLSSEELKESDFYPFPIDEIVRPFVGSSDFIRGELRYCIWINDPDKVARIKTDSFLTRLRSVSEFRSKSSKAATRALADEPHRFSEIRNHGESPAILVPKVSSESRYYLPAGLLKSGAIVSDNAFGLYDAPLWNLSLLTSRLHLVWIATVCGKMKTDFRYSNTMGWNTFPVPSLTEKNKDDLTRCTEDILLAREAHFPATIADLYNPEKMPEDLRHAHERNDEVLERIYIGRRFKNDTERLEKLFDLYTKMTTPSNKMNSKKKVS